MAVAGVGHQALREENSGLGDCQGCRGAHRKGGRGDTEYHADIEAEVRVVSLLVGGIGGGICRRPYCYARGASGREPESVAQELVYRVSISRYLGTVKIPWSP